jgi:hypothetical protein
VKNNDLLTAAKYALAMMESHEQYNNVSLGFDCAMSLLRDAIGIKLEEIDERNLFSIGFLPTEKSGGLPEDRLA